LSLVVFCCNFSTLQHKPHDYICSGCKNMVSQKCTVFIGPPCSYTLKWEVMFTATLLCNIAACIQQVSNIHIAVIKIGRNYNLHQQKTSHNTVVEAARCCKTN